MSGTANTGSMGALELIEQAQHELLGIQMRCTTLAAFEAELRERTRGEPFTIMNDLVWTTMIDARDMLLVHFAQWILSALHAGGLFKRLRMCPMSSFYVRTTPDPDAWKPVRLMFPGASDAEVAALKRESAELAHRRRLELFREVFPMAAQEKRKPRHADLEVLEHQFWTALEPVVRDRNENRAHPHYGPAPTKATAKMLHFAEIEGHANWATEFLNRLRLLVNDSQWGAWTPTSDAEATAKDLVDLVLFGSRDRMDFLSGISEDAHTAAGRYALQYRAALYEKLWSERRRSDVPFNDPAQLREDE